MGLDFGSFLCLLNLFNTFVLLYWRDGVNVSLIYVEGKGVGEDFT